MATRAQLIASSCPGSSELGQNALLSNWKIHLAVLLPIFFTLINFQMWWKSSVTSLSSQSSSTSSKLPIPTWKRSSYRRKSSKVFWKALKYTHILKNNSRIHQLSQGIPDRLLYRFSRSPKQFNWSKHQQKVYQLFFFWDHSYKPQLEKVQNITEGNKWFDTFFKIFT